MKSPLKTGEWERLVLMKLSFAHKIPAQAKERSNEKRRWSHWPLAPVGGTAQRGVELGVIAPGAGMGRDGRLICRGEKR